jgi:hypothetical protein
VKIEPHQRSVTARENPVKFVGCILWYLCFASGFTVAAVMFALSLLR